jgi:uncharacterized Zn-binding protein involved in type VI secretion
MGVAQAAATCPKKHVLAVRTARLAVNVDGCPVVTDGQVKQAGAVAAAATTTATAGSRT